MNFVFVATFFMMLLIQSTSFQFIRKLPRNLSTRVFSSSADEVKTYLLQYKYVENMGDKRGPYREGHLALAKKLLEEKKIIAGGAFAPALDGALFIFKSSKSDVEAFVKQDPYVEAGLVPEHFIHDWTVAIGSVDK